MKLTRLCSHAPVAALLTARVGQTMSRNVMWSSFCNVIFKPVFTLRFSRAYGNDPRLYHSLLAKISRARALGGIVVTTYVFFLLSYSDQNSL